MEHEKLNSLSQVNQENVYVRISTTGPKRKALLMQDLKANLAKLAGVKTELYGKILISGDPIEYDEED